MYTVYIFIPEEVGQGVQDVGIMDVSVVDVVVVGKGVVVSFGFFKTGLGAGWE